MLTYKRHWSYFKYVIRHKYYVFVEGIKLGVPLHLLILHDWSKFLPSEWFPYARTFYTPDGTGQYVESAEFNNAWNHHQKSNKHHWQYWMLTFDKGNTVCIEMPEKYRLEMLADWKGAGKAITGKDNTDEWYLKNKDNMILHAFTRNWIEDRLGVRDV